VRGDRASFLGGFCGAAGGATAALVVAGIIGRAATRRAMHFASAQLTYELQRTRIWGLTHQALTDPDPVRARDALRKADELALESAQLLFPRSRRRRRGREDARRRRREKRLAARWSAVSTGP